MMIARPQDNNDLIWKHPVQTIPMFAQCTVRADEWAVFMKEGHPHGSLDVGRIILSPTNIPFLSQFVDQYSDGNFLMADLFFVKRTPFLVHIAGDMGATFDPLANVRLHPQCTGEATVRVINPELLLYYILMMQWSVEPRSLIDRIESIVLSAIRSAALQLASEQRETVLSVLCDPANLAAAAHRSDYMAQHGLKIAAISAFDVEVPPQEFDSHQLAPAARTTSREAEGKTTLPPLVQQIFDRGVWEGELRGKRETLLRLLRRVGLPLNEDEYARIQACASTATLDQWVDNIWGAKTARDVLS